MYSYKDRIRAVKLYTQALGMQLLSKSKNPEYKYSLAFVGYEGNPACRRIATCIKLTAGSFAAPLSVIKTMWLIGKGSARLSFRTLPVVM